MGAEAPQPHYQGCHQVRGKWGQRELAPRIGSEGIPGLLAHPGLLYTGQRVLSSFAGLLHIAIHEAQKGGILCLHSSCKNSRVE